MHAEGRSFSALGKEIRRQLYDGNRLENRRSQPSKLAKIQLEAFCEQIADQGKLVPQKLEVKR